MWRRFAQSQHSEATVRPGSCVILPEIREPDGGIARRTLILWRKTIMRISTTLVATLFTIPNLLSAQDLVRPVGERQIPVGVGISCSYCRLAFPEYQFTIPPMISEVKEGSIAAKAGLMVGDTLTAIEGEPITTGVGANYFGSRIPGTTQKWTVRRADKEVTVTLVIPEDA